MQSDSILPRSDRWHKVDAGWNESRSVDGSWPAAVDAAIRDWQSSNKEATNVYKPSPLEPLLDLGLDVGQDDFEV